MPHNVYKLNLNLLILVLQVGARLIRPCPAKGRPDPRRAGGNIQILRSEKGPMRVRFSFLLQNSQIRVRVGNRNLKGGDRSEVAGLYAAGAVVETCHDLMGDPVKR